MKKLDKSQEAQREEFIKQLTAAHDGVKEAHSKLVSETDAYNSAIQTYNEVLVNVETWTGEITSSMSAYMEEKSERWAEGEAGTEYGDWKDTWDGISFEQIDALEIPSEPEIEEFITEFGDLPSEPG